jgi:hypothetical protein
MHVQPPHYIYTQLHGVLLGYNIKQFGVLLGYNIKHLIQEGLLSLTGWIVYKLKTPIPHVLNPYVDSDHAFLSTDCMSYFQPDSKITPFFFQTDLLLTVAHSFLTEQAKLISICICRLSMALFQH